MTIATPDRIASRIGGTVTRPVGAAAGPARLRFGQLAVYGVGGTAEHVVQFGLSNLLLFYLTIVCGLSGSAAGLAIGSAMILDAVVQPLMGSLSDNSRSDLGRRHPFMIAGAIPLALGVGLLYSVPAGLGGGALLAYVVGALFMTRIAHAVFNIPYVALGAELSEDYHERSRVVGARLLCGAIGGVFATYLAYGVFMKGHAGQAHRQGYTPFGWTCAAIVLAGAAVSIVGTWVRRRGLAGATPAVGNVLARFVRELGQLFRNGPFRALFLTAVANQVAWGAATALALHANTYFWKLTTPQILLVSMLGIGGYLVGCLVGIGLAGRIQKRAKVFMGLGLIAACQLALVPAGLAGLIAPGATLAAVAVATVLSQAGMSITLIGFQSMMADVADQQEHQFGGRREGLCYAGTTLAAFGGNGLGAMLAGFSLDLIGFPHGVAKHAHLHLAPSVVQHLALVYGPGAGLISVLAILSMLSYRLGRAEHAALRVELLKRRAALPVT